MVRKFTKSEAAEFFARLKRQMPEPRTELEYKNPYTLLVAVVLSAQATDKGVNKATKALFEIADTPEKMVKLGEARLTQHIKTIGLYRNKAKNVIALSKALAEQHRGHVPRDREALEALPGVGRKSANVVLNVAFGEPVIAVDTHIFRVSNRTGLAPGKNPKAVRLRAEPSGDGNDYREIAVRAFRGTEAIADLVVGLDVHGNLRVVCTANGEGDGDHAVALFPELPAGEMVRRTVCDLDAPPKKS